MILNYNPTELEKITYDFFNTTGINLAILDSEFQQLEYKKCKQIPFCALIQQSKDGHKLCYQSDCALLSKCRQGEGAQSHICHAGLTDMAIPIFYLNTPIAYIILGQIKTKSDFGEIEAKLSMTDVDKAELKRLYDEMPLWDSDKISSIANIATILSKHILIGNMISPLRDKSIENAIDFINNNLSHDLSIEFISKSTGISPSSLYKLFHTHLNCTVGDYINNKRVEKAKELLLDNELTIEMISQSTGFSSAAYFSKIFKSRLGQSPTSYRKNIIAK